MSIPSLAKSLANPVLRPAVPADVDAIAVLWHRAWPDGHLGHVPEALLPHRRLEDFRRWVPALIRDMTVAFSGGAITGFVAVTGAEVQQLYVAREARGGGTATALLAHAERWIGRSFAAAWLAVVPGNARARRFYERNGWEDTGAFQYDAHTASGSIPVPCRRYARHLAR